MRNDMQSFKTTALDIAQKLVINQIQNEDDYINPDDGLLYCGKCRTPKQCLMEIPFLKNESEQKLYKLPIVCECVKKKTEEEERQKNQAEEMRIVESLRSKSLMDEKFKGQTFDTFRPTKENERALRLCKRYAEGFDEMLEHNQGLLFWGDVGTGKTFSAACIANALLEKKISVMMTSFVKLLESLQSFKEGEEERLMRQMNKAKLLIIDDLGAERSTDFALEKVYNIIDSRYRAKLPMILTTNLDLEDMKRTTDIRYSRIYDRIFEVCYPVKFTGQSFRKAEANRRYKEMKDFLEG